MFHAFAENTHLRLFDGPQNHLRQFYSAEARASGMFTLLGTMVGHSILQDGVGFPFFSPVCFWYIADGDKKTLQYASLADVGADVATVISQVSTHNYFLSAWRAGCRV